MITATGYFTSLIVITVFYMCWAASELDRHLDVERTLRRRIARLEGELEHERGAR